MDAALRVLLARKAALTLEAIKAMLDRKVALPTVGMTSFVVNMSRYDGLLESKTTDSTHTTTR